MCVCVWIDVMYVLFGWGGGLEVGRWMGVVCWCVGVFVQT